MTGEELKQQIALYESADHTVHLDVKVDEDTVWLNRQQLALLFGRDIKTIGKHVGNALREELNGFSVVAKFATTASDGKTYQVEHYNLDMILSVGYRVKSKEGIYFRRWANSVLKQHLVDGYTINRKRLDALHAVVKVLSRSTEPEIAGTAEILERYLPSLVLLNDYDTGNVPIPKGDESQWVLTYEDAMLFIRSMPFYMQSDLFGRERNGSFQGIVAGLYQTFGGEELYVPPRRKPRTCCIKLSRITRSPTAINVVPPHCSCISRTATVYWATMTPLLVEGNALAAMTLMIALSAPAGKDTMIALVENFLIRHESQEIN